MRYRLALLAGALLVAAGCRLELDVNVTVDEDGGGSVEVVVGLDEDAVRRIGGDVEAVMAVDDLVDAGWTVDGPTLEQDGVTRVRIERRFADPEEAGAVFAQIAGEEGPFQDFAVTKDDGFAESRWRFSGRVDFRGGLEAFGDEGLAAELGGEPLGQTVEEIEEQLGDSLSRLIQVRVSARLPGDVTSNATTKAGNGAVWQVGFGEDAIELEAEGTQRRTLTLVLAGVAALCALALLLYGLLRAAARVTQRDAAA